VIGGAPVRTGLEEEDAPASVGELAGHYAAARARADDHDIEVLAHPPIPR
jgi:hypothetical protein